MIEKTFRVDCRHAAGAGRCNGLSINRILYVAAGENAGNVRGRRMSGSLDVADLVHVEPAFEKIRVWLVTDGDKHAGAWKLDRKSTRLNSSHSQISYAVFCLKKKKKQIKRN